ncbi:MAG TPA: methyltransferase domain-containing protein [Burkholderiales bacterium]|nr:methyltransferase domain-containing protein [Burkholderiales bacterium]
MIVALKKLIKKVPGVIPMIVHTKRVRALKSFERLPLDRSEDSNNRSFRQIHNLLNYTKTSGSYYSALQFPAGYHSIDIDGHRLQGKRDPAQRLERIPIDFSGKTLLDIGCNQGGMLFQLDRTIKSGVGIDYDPRMINVANRIKALRGAGNLQFYVFDLEKEPLALLEDLIPVPKVDVVFLLAVCMWLKNWRSVISCAAKISDMMVFESNGTESQQAAQIAYLKELYRDVTLVAEHSDDDPKQKRRKLFWCREAVAANDARVRSAVKREQRSPVTESRSTGDIRDVRL